jgi:hypothetical protein
LTRLTPRSPRTDCFASCSTEREQRLLVERPADQLQAQRQALAVLAGRHGDAGQAGHVHRHREDVVEIHLDRIGAMPFSPMPKAADGVAGVRIASMPAARLVLEIALDQRADLLRRR